jgi:hypothetical protein
MMSIEVSPFLHQFGATLTRIDPYNAEDKNPFTSNAIKSSCWELSSLQTHYLSSVSILAKIFTEVFTKPEFNMEDFMDHGYGTVSLFWDFSWGFQANRLAVRDRDQEEDQV